MYQNRLQEIDELKAKIDSHRLLSEDIVKQIQKYYKIGLTYSSNALEGNTLDLAETKVVIEDGLTINGKPMKDHLETLGHALAFNELLELLTNLNYDEEKAKKKIFDITKKLDIVHILYKREKELLKLNHRLTNIRQNYLHQTTSEIINRKPRFICMEDLNVKGMMKNKHLSKSVQQQCFGEFRRQIEYKSAWNHIPVIIADKWFPSSKLCNCCGNIKKDLKLSDRIYKCECGNVIDRDYQASLNLKRYGENVLKSVI